MRAFSTPFNAAFTFFAGPAMPATSIVRQDYPNVCAKLTFALDALVGSRLRLRCRFGFRLRRRFCTLALFLGRFR